MRFFLLCLCVVFVAANLPAQTLTSAEKPAYYWPASPRVPAKFTDHWVTFDSAKMQSYKISLIGHKLEVPYLAAFAIGPNDDRYNTTFIIPEQAEIKWGVAVFEKGDFLPSASAASLNAYIHGLKIKGATDIKSTVTGDQEYTAAILGRVPEEVIYTKGKTKYHEYILDHKGKIWVFAYQAPEKIFGSNDENVRVILARLRLIDQ